jgi:hypothetical protein
MLSASAFLYGRHGESATETLSGSSAHGRSTHHFLLPNPFVQRAALAIHSSFGELREFVRRLQPRKVTPCVAGNRGSEAEIKELFAPFLSPLPVLGHGHDLTFSAQECDLAMAHSVKTIPSFGGNAGMVICGWRANSRRLVHCTEQSTQSAAEKPSAGVGSHPHPLERRLRQQNISLPERVGGRHNPQQVRIFFP